MTRQRMPAAERRAQILVSAVQCFAKHGYRGATTKRIAAEAGVAEALIYRYFGSKLTLFREAVDNMAVSMLEGLQMVFERHSESPLAALSAMLNIYERTLVQHRDLAKMIFVVSAELDDPEVREIYLPHQQRALRMIGSAVKHWQLAGQLRGDVSPRSVSWLFLGTFQALALMKHAGQLEQIDIEEALRLARPFVMAPT